jgi:hypothetical protein
MYEHEYHEDSSGGCCTVSQPCPGPEPDIKGCTMPDPADPVQTDQGIQATDEPRPGDRINFIQGIVTCGKYAFSFLATPMGQILETACPDGLLEPDMGIAIAMSKALKEAGLILESLKLGGGSGPLIRTECNACNRTGRAPDGSICRVCQGHGYWLRKA